MVPFTRSERGHVNIQTLCRSYLGKCRAKRERKKLQKKDLLFLCGDAKRFRRPRKVTCDGFRIRVGDRVLTEKDEFLNSRKDHFGDLGKSLLSSTPELSHLPDEVKNMMYLNEDSTLDWDVTVEEIQCMIKRLKSPGPDGMVAEHVIYGGSDCGYITFLVVSLDMKLYHKHGLTTPVHKLGEG